VIVADTNLIVYLVLQGDHSQAAEAAYRMDPEWIAPSSWRVEFVNAMTTYCRTKRATIEEAMEAYRRATGVVRDYQFDVDVERVIRLSVDSGRSGYDCLFVVAALVNSLPLVTFDQQVLRSFPDTAIMPDQIQAWFDRRGI
jgi:predicted nucleic acid-binding protein